MERTVRFLYFVKSKKIFIEDRAEFCRFVDQKEDDKDKYIIQKIFEFKL
jgi:hypothetical protein